MGLPSSLKSKPLSPSSPSLTSSSALPVFGSHLSPQRKAEGREGLFAKAKKRVRFAGVEEAEDMEPTAAAGDEFATLLARSRHRRIARTILLSTLFVGYAAYLITACIMDFQRAIPLLVLSSLVASYVLYQWIVKHWGSVVFERCGEPCLVSLRAMPRVYRNVLYVLGVFVCVLWIVVDTMRIPLRLISVLGLFVFISLSWLCSKHRKYIKWRPVVWGLVLQFLIGILIMRTTPGARLFNLMGAKMTVFLSFSDEGSRLVFGESFADHYFAFKVIPTIVFFSAFISVCYHYGILQRVIAVLAQFMQLTMGTTAAESLVAAGNIFAGQIEAVLMVRPLVGDMSLAELHCIMTSGFATVAGGVMVAYVAFGINGTHILAASCMSAPAALAVSKLVYPETEVKDNVQENPLELNVMECENAIEAAAKGAADAIPLVANVVAMLIAFLALLALVNAVLGWCGSFVGFPDLSLDLICGYVLLPVPFLMGVDWYDCRTVASLLGKKTFVNEFVAYIDLAELINNRIQGKVPALTLRSELITTYALCGFANIGSIGIQLGGLTAIAPHRSRDFAKLGVRAMVSGTVACFMTACVAGILYE